MRVYFLRHGPAGDPQAWRGDDFARPLTADGRKSVAREAKRINDLDLGIELVLTSPLVRAKQTAEIVADRLKLRDSLAEDDRLGKHFDTEKLAEIMRERAKVETIMLVGHEPDMSAVIGRVAGGARLELKKGGLACVDFRDVSSLDGTLIMLVAPRVLR